MVFDLYLLFEAFLGEAWSIIFIFLSSLSLLNLWVSCGDGVEVGTGAGATAQAHIKTAQAIVCLGFLSKSLTIFLECSFNELQVEAKRFVFSASGAFETFSKHACSSWVSFGVFTDIIK